MKPHRLFEASPTSDVDLNPRRDPALDFPERELGEMSPADYQAIGFMSGLEVHQQLATRRKLFCRCPAGQRVTRVDAEVLRHMRPTLSELGQYDACALMEFKTRKEIIYLIERGSVCTYEIDDTPPFEIDPEAVDIAIAISLLFELNLVSELHVMRKQYLDGSIPTGFQRTTLLGVAGRLLLREPELGLDREVALRQLSLEEDSCREVSDVGHEIIFRTDRLGTPLTETVTEPELYTPWELQAAARLIARTTQATGRVRRGAGAARQDVNVSVAGGRRVELKGVPHHRRLPQLVHVEAFRQLNLLRLKAELERRGVSPGALADPREEPIWRASGLTAEVSEIVAGCPDPPSLRNTLERGGRACAVKLPGFADLLGYRTQPNRCFADELADRVRVIACLTARPFMSWSAQQPALFGGTIWQELRAELKAGADDAVVLLWGAEDDLDLAAREVLARAREALVGVPSETRQACADGSSGFERILPGPERMYPDTDTPPLAIADRRVEEIRSRLPEPPHDRSERYRRLGLGAAAAWRLAVSPWGDSFDRLAPRSTACARRLAAALEKRLPHYARRLGLNSPPLVSRLEPLVQAMDGGRLRPEAFERVFDRLAVGREAPEVVIAEHTARGDEDALLERLLEDTGAALGQLRSREREAALRWAMGRVMPKLLGRMDPTRVEQRLRELLTQRLGNCDD